MSFLNQILEEAFRDLDPGPFPFSFGIEVTNHCNLRCPMCPREIADRGYGNMPLDLFKQLADQAAEHKKRLVLPQGFGESFINPRFREMLLYLNEKGVHPIMVITNATLLTEKNVDALVDANVDFLNVSLDGTDPETYESIRVNADYDTVVKNVEYLFQRRKERGSILPRIILRMIEMKGMEADKERFRAKWQPFLLDGDEIAFSKYQTWNGSVEDKRNHVPEGVQALNNGHRGPCRMLYKTMQVYYDGRATPCCYDYDCTMEIGNVKTQSVQEIWNGEKAQHFRRLHEEGRIAEIPICRNCEEYTP